MTEQNNALIDAIKWNSQGLVPAIAQDANSKKVLMMAWINRDALIATFEKGEAIYWSRSRQRLWHKGESSGHIQKIMDIRLDCDGDTLLLMVEQIGGIACHTGRESCMYKQYSASDGWVSVEAPLKNPDDIY
ncbi:MAG: phosphoribosyl-AMP cyclohydrolase [Cellvibrionales bacterium]|jgi:phosphoribosyl-AMP cyclohydrolase|nr:phosphoribosyl-AMP cyclohydrolase [Cellvibrionales bacterium]